MALNSTEILLELTTEEIVILRDYFKQRQDVVPHIYSNLHTILVWRAKAPESEKNLIQVFAPQGNPNTNYGTFISVANFPVIMITAFTMEEPCNLLSKILSTTKRFDYRRDNIIFYAIHDDHISALDKVMTEKGLKIIMGDKTVLYSLSQEEAILRIPSFSKDYILEKLKDSDASTIFDVWPHREHNTIDYIRFLIEYNGGWGMFTRDDKKLVAWILKSQNGYLALLQVSEEYKGKGLAQALIDAMSKHVASEGIPAIATIVQSNEPSLKLFTKCGFKRRFIVGYYLYK